MSNDTIFREVDEELRGERMRNLWRRFAPVVIGGAVAIVLLVAANEGWSWWQASNAARSSDQFYAALERAEAGDVAAAQEALNEVVAQATGGYPTLARFRQASLLARGGKTAEAVAAYDALATAQSNARLREIALVLAANLLADGGDVAAVQQRVGGLATPQSPMRNAAREAIGLTQYRAGDSDAAQASFEQILADPQAGQDIRSRVQVYVAQLQAMAPAPVVSAPAADPAPATTTTAPPADRPAAASPPNAPEAAPEAEGPAATTGEAPATAPGN